LRLEHLDTRFSSSQNVKAVGKLNLGIFSSEQINAFVLDLGPLRFRANDGFFLVEVVFLAGEKDRHHLMFGKSFKQFICYLGDGEFKPKFLIDVKG
jgi:hypothetical protein